MSVLSSYVRMFLPELFALQHTNFFTFHALSNLQFGLHPLSVSAPTVCNPLHHSGHFLESPSNFQSDFVGIP